MIHGQARWFLIVGLCLASSPAAGAITMGGGQSAAGMVGSSTAGGTAAAGSDSGGKLGRKALLVTRPSVSKGDAALRRRLEGLGFEVILVKDTDPALPGPFSLIVISEASESADVGTKYTNNPAPIVTSEQGSLGRLGMASGGKKVKGQTAIQIGDLLHPIAAGLKGKVEVYSTAAVITYGTLPAPSVSKVATLDPKAPDAAASFSLLAVEKGAVLNGGLTAPGRRAYWFVEDEFTAQLTPDAWKIFDACVAWATGRR